MNDRRSFLAHAARWLAAGSAATMRAPGAWARDSRTGAFREPAWLASQPAQRWIALPGTELAAGSDLSAQIAAGLTNAAGEDIGYGRPRRGILDFSGGTLKRTGSELLIFGGGGAGAWAGNDVRGLRLEDDSPRWRTRVAPTPARFVHERRRSGGQPQPYLRNGDPNARHSYFQPQFDDANDRIYALGCQNVWEIDDGRFNTVDSATLGGPWTKADAHPPIPMARGYDGSWTCRHSETGRFYASGQFAIASFDPAANAWHGVHTGEVAGIDRGQAAIDDDGRLLRIGDWNTERRVPLLVDTAGGGAVRGELAGPFAAAIRGDYQAGMVWDPGLAAFVYFQDDGFLYTLRRGPGRSVIADRLSVAGTPPTPGDSSVHNGGSCAIYGRMQYAPNLKGIVIMQRYDRPAYFVRTA